LILCQEIDVDDSMPEEWRAVVDWEGLYEVSSQGQVRSVRRKGTRGKVLKPGLDQDGYRKVVLSFGSVQSMHKVATLVAAAFIGPRPDDCVVRHGDGDNHHDAADNLSYGTQGENIADQVRHGTHANARKTCCSKCGGAYSFRKDGRRYCKACAAISTRAAQGRYRERQRRQAA
jgi:hypothetical protein